MKDEYLISLLGGVLSSRIFDLGSGFSVVVFCDEPPDLCFECPWTHGYAGAYTYIEISEAAARALIEKALADG